jgi:hypothetical protein
MVTVEEESAVILSEQLVIVKDSNDHVSFRACRSSAGEAASIK